MSVALKKGINVNAESRKCAARLWRLFPHVLLCLTLVAYAALGALLFQYIEGKSASTTQKDYRLFLGQIVGAVKNLTGKLAANTCYHLIKKRNVVIAIDFHRHLPYVFRKRLIHT